MELKISKKASAISPSPTLAIDSKFKEMKKEVNRVLDQLDHQYLNELPVFANGYNPTAEHIAKYVYDELKGSELLHADCRLKYVKIWESPKSAVIYSEGEQQ